MSLNDLLKQHWTRYEQNLREAGFQSPYDWYTQDTFLNEDNYRIDDPEHKRWAPLHDHPLHVLFRVMGYRDQPLGFVMHNPGIKLTEVGVSSSEIEAHEDEIGKLSDYDTVDPIEFGKVCCPNWGYYIANRVGGDEYRGGVIKKDGDWAKRGQVFELLEKHATVVDIPEDRESYFEGEGDTAPFFDDFYYTNVFKLPTPTGVGASVFEDSPVPENFYKDLTRDELSTADLDVAFVFGGPAKDAMLPEADLVRNGQGEPIGDGEERHGFLYRLPSSETFIIASVHPAYSTGRDEDPLEFNIEYLAEQGIL